MRKFNKYLVLYSADEEKTGIKGIRSDAPKDVIDDFIEWYRNNNRYENGRMLPKSSKVLKDLIIDVGVSLKPSDEPSIQSQTE